MDVRGVTQAHEENHSPPNGTRFTKALTGNELGSSPGTVREELPMAGKRLLFKSEARGKALSGATALADAVCITLGPKSKCSSQEC